MLGRGGERKGNDPYKTCGRRRPTVSAAGKGLLTGSVKSTLAITKKKGEAVSLLRKMSVPNEVRSRRKANKKGKQPFRAAHKKRQDIHRRKDKKSSKRQLRTGQQKRKGCWLANGKLPRERKRKQTGLPSQRKDAARGRGALKVRGEAIAVWKSHILRWVPEWSCHRSVEAAGGGDVLEPGQESGLIHGEGKG